MLLALDNRFTKAERNYISYYFVEITDGKFISIDSINLSQFLSRLSYPEFSEYNDNNKDHVTLTPKEKTALAIKLMEWIMSNDEAFIQVIMSDIVLFHQCLILHSLRPLQGELFKKAALTLQTNKEARESLITSISDIYSICIMNHYPVHIFLRALLEANDLNRLLNSYQELCFEIGRFPKLTLFFLASIAKNAPLREILFPSVKKVSKFREFLLEKGLLTRGARGFLQQIEDTLEQSRINESAVASTSSFFPAVEIASAATSSSSSAASSFSSSTTSEQNEDEELSAPQAQSDEVQQAFTMFTKLSLFSPSAALQESDNPSIRQSAEAISASLKETEKSIGCEAAGAYPLSEPF